MDEPSPAVELPGLYRSVLDRIARLEQIGERSAAANVRHDAIAAYSGRWDEHGRRRMRRLVHDCDRLLHGDPIAERLAALHASSEPI